MEVTHFADQLELEEDADANGGDGDEDEPEQKAETKQVVLNDAVSDTYSISLSNANAIRTDCHAQTVTLEVAEDVVDAKQSDLAELHGVDEIPIFESVELDAVNFGDPIIESILNQYLDSKHSDLDLVYQHIQTFGENERARFESELDKIRNGLHQNGMFEVTNHGISPSLIQRMYENASSFFKEPLKYKMKYNDGGFYDPGYVPFGFEQIESTSTKTKESQCDPMESFFLLADTESVFAPKITDLPPHFQREHKENGNALTSSYWTEMLSLLKKVHLLSSLCLNLKQNVFENVMTASSSNKRTHSLKFANYFDLERNEYGLNMKTAPIRYGKHRDWLSFTVLKTDKVGGLQLLDQARNEWMDAVSSPSPSSFIVIAGQLIERMTNKYFKAMPHRVISKPQQRLSMAFFTGPALASYVSTMPFDVCPMCYDHDKDGVHHYGKDNEPILVNHHLNAITKRTDLHESDAKKFHSL